MRETARSSVSHFECPPPGFLCPMCRLVPGTGLQTGTACPLRSVCADLDTFGFEVGMGYKNITPTVRVYYVLINIKDVV